MVYDHLGSALPPLSLSPVSLGLGRPGLSERSDTDLCGDLREEQRDLLVAGIGLVRTVAAGSWLRNPAVPATWLAHNKKKRKGPESSHQLISGMSPNYGAFPKVFGCLGPRVQMFLKRLARSKLVVARLATRVYVPVSV